MRAASGERVAPSKKVLKKLLAKFGDKLDDNFVYGMKFVLGEVDADPALQKMIDHIDDVPPSAEDADPVGIKEVLEVQA